MRKRILCMLMTLAMCVGCLPVTAFAAEEETHTSHDSITWTEWTDSTNLPASGDYCLATDVTISDNQTITGELNLCLNGHKITHSNTNRYVIVDSNATLNLYDCGEAGKISFTGGNQVIENKGTFNMYSGCIEGPSYHGCIRNYGTLNIYGGKVENTYNAGSSYPAIENSAVLNISGGTIRAYTNSIEQEYSCPDSKTTISGDASLSSSTNSTIQIYSGEAEITGGNISNTGGSMTLYGNQNAKIRVSGGTFTTKGVMFQSTYSDFLVTGGNFYVGDDNTEPVNIYVFISDDYPERARIIAGGTFENGIKIKNGYSNGKPFIGDILVEGYGLDGKDAVDLKTAKELTGSDLTTEWVGIKPTGVTLDQTTLALQMSEKETATLMATISPANATDKTVTWTSSDASVATVDDKGNVKAAGIGEATITVTTKEAGKTDTCTVTVSPAPGAYIVTFDAKGGNCATTSAVTGTDGKLTSIPEATRKGYTFKGWFDAAKGGNEITVDTEFEENKTVYAQWELIAKHVVNWSGSCKEAHTVKIDFIERGLLPDNITITSASFSVGSAVLDGSKGMTKEFGTDRAFIQFVTKVLENTTVDAKDTITVVLDSNHGTITIDINITLLTDWIAVTGVTLDETETELKLNETATLTATVSPEDATDKTVTWTSSDTSVATVDENGVITAVGAGTAIITAQAGDVTATCEVTVKAASSGKKTKKYDVVIKQTDNGDIEVDDDYAKRGQEITITVDPDKDYELDELTIIDIYGEEVDYNEGKKDNTFVFDMPKGDVTIEASFEKVSSADEDDKDKQEVVPDKEEDISVNGGAEKFIKLTIDQKIAWVFDAYVVNDVAPVISNERTMLPIRFIAEALGGDVAWDEAAQTVSITKGDIEMEIYIGQSFALVNGAPVQLDSPAFIENDRTYLPLRFVAENLGAEVAWDGMTQTVTIFPKK